MALFNFGKKQEEEKKAIVVLTEHIAVHKEHYEQKEKEQKAGAACFVTE